jgi:tellurite resistance protein TehA-like permease
MATGGIANVLASIPFETRWLDIVGLVFFFFNLVVFMTICVMIGFRFHYRPGSFISTFTDQVESLFIPATVVSIATILITVCEYGIPNTGPWLLHVMEILFWIYVAFATIASAGIYLTLWSTLTFPIHTMTPTWVFPAYPMLLTAPFGGSLINAAIQRKELHHLCGPAIMFASVTVQGAGFLIAFMICSAFIYRLMTQKLPRDAQRPGVFISIGPFGFTVAGILNLGNKAELILPDGFLSIPNSVSILKILSTMVGLWLWGLCIWFFLVSVGSLWKYVFPNHRLPFQVTWFSFVFPNTALVTATFQLGDALDSHPLKVLGCVLAAVLVAVWLFVFAGLVRGFWRRELLWPKDED